MALIPGWVVGLVTFPGIIVHELGHLLLCRIAKVKVLGWCLFQLKQPMGFVVHEQPDSVWKNFLITFVFGFQYQFFNPKIKFFSFINSKE